MSPPEGDSLFGDEQPPAEQPPAEQPLDATLATAKPKQQRRKRGAGTAAGTASGAADGATASKQATAVLTQFERYEVIELHRSEIHGAPYNPRTITPKARKRLRDVAKVGLLGPVIVNRTTGYTVIAGHQRLSVLDALERTQNYRLHVAVVDLDPKAEKEQNIFLNNAAAQGEFDLAMLEKILKEDKLDFDAAGFDTGEMYQMFGDDPFVDQPEALSALAERIREAAGNQKHQMENYEESRDLDFYLVVVFRSGEDRQQFTETLELPDNMYADGRQLWGILEQCGAIAGAESTADQDSKIKVPFHCCERCGMDHAGLMAYRLAAPIAGLQATYWASCPTNGEPIFLHPAEDEIAALHVEAMKGAVEKKNKKAAKLLADEEKNKKSTDRRPDDSAADQIADQIADSSPESMVFEGFG